MCLNVLTRSMMDHISFIQAAGMWYKLSCPRSCVRDRVSCDRFRAFALVGLEFHQCVYFPSKNALEN